MQQAGILGTKALSQIIITNGPVPMDNTIARSRVDLLPLYHTVKQPGALEWQAIRFWSTFCEVWGGTQGFVTSISAQLPPSEDPRAAERLRRIDFSVDAFDARHLARFSLFYAEGKGQYASQEEKEYVESQAFNACRGYANSTSTEVVSCMCVVGTRARLFQFVRSTMTWGPMWGEDTDDPEQSLEYYIDADHPGSKEIWRALNTIRDTCGKQLASSSQM